MLQATPTRERPTAVRDRERATRSAELVRQARERDPEAFGLLYDMWFRNVHDVAHRILRNEALAAEVTQETFLAAWTHLETLEDPEVFGGWLLRIARNKSINAKRKESRSVPVDSEGLTVIEAGGTSGRKASTVTCVEDRIATFTDPETAAEDAELAALLWEAAAALGEKDATLLDLHLRHGLGPGEIAAAMRTNRNSAYQAVHRLKQRLGSALRARVLWRSGQPRCTRLRSALSGHRQFEAATARLINAHAAACPECHANQETQLSPRALFSAVPLAGVPILLKAKVARALDESGVPMGHAVSGSNPSDTGSTHGESTSRRSRRSRKRSLPAAPLLLLCAVLVVLLPADLGDPSGAASDGLEGISGIVVDAGTTPGSDHTTAPYPVAPGHESGEAPPAPDISGAGDGGGTAGESSEPARTTESPSGESSESGGGDGSGGAGAGTAGTGGNSTQSADSTAGAGGTGAGSGSQSGRSSEDSTRDSSADDESPGIAP